MEKPGAGSDCRGRTTRLEEGGGRNVDHVLECGGCHKERNTRMDSLLPTMFSSVDRLGQGDSKARVGSSKIFFGSQGALTVAEDSRDEGGVAGVPYDH